MDMDMVVVVSLCMLAGIVVLCEAARRATRNLIDRNRTECRIYANEIISTIQLCACAHELTLLSEDEPKIALCLTYVISVVHGLTFRGASGNPTGTLESYWFDSLGGACALGRTTCQFAAAVAAGLGMRYPWALGFSDLHARHARSGFTCTSPIESAHLVDAVAVEFACTFFLHAAVRTTCGVEENCRVFAVAAVITTLVYAGGSTTGAMFNPALALSTLFPCDGSTFVKHVLVYCVGPFLGMVCSRLLFTKIVQAFTAKDTRTRKDQSLDAAKQKKKRN